MKRNGYPLVGEKVKISNLLRFWYFLQQKIIGEIQIQYQWRFNRLLRQLKDRG
jgi:hypothetical protein